MAMPDAPSKRRWDAENVRVITFKLFRKNDEDIIDFLEGKVRGEVIKAALREYMANHKEEE